VRQAGVREARQNLSALLGFVHAGHEILITDRGRPVARLVAPLPLSVKAFPGRAAFRRRMKPLQPPLAARRGGGEDAALRGIWPRRLSGPSYLDGTALARLYLPGPESAAVERLVRGRRDVTVSELSVTELMVAYAARGQGGARSTGPRLQAAVLEDLESGAFRRVELSPATHRAAERMALSLDTPSPGSGAPLHLALAMTAGVSSVVTFDRDLARAAEKAGLLAVPSPRP
jgi:antitoxin (DNA-binding transcriptional repressor) of toxin-antitoxin stability system/predicted nucleic acid-binding protein